MSHDERNVNKTDDGSVVLSPEEYAKLLRAAGVDPTTEEKLFGLSYALTEINHHTGLRYEVILADGIELDEEKKTVTLVGLRNAVPVPPGWAASDSALTAIRRARFAVTGRWEDTPDDFDGSTPTDTGGKL